MATNILDSLLNFIGKNTLREDFIISKTVHTGSVDLSGGKYQTVNIKPPKVEGYKPFGVVGWSPDRYYIAVVTVRDIEDGTYDIMIRALESISELNAGATINFAYFKIGGGRITNLFHHLRRKVVAVC